MTVHSPAPACDRRLSNGGCQMAVNYVFDDVWLEERARLGSLEAALDPGTIGHLSALGVGPGCDCLEVGAGAGSIASWLCQRVSAKGHVVACDVQTTFLQKLDYPNLEIWRHDIVTDPLPPDSFDLVHVRLDPALAPRRPSPSMASSLRPGGLDLLQDPAFTTYSPMTVASWGHRTSNP